MRPFRVADFAAATGARLAWGDPERELAGVCTDTRTLRAGELFLALDGPNFRGNDFARAAVRGGAGALCLTEDGSDFAGDAELRPPGALLVHPEPRRALGRFAAWHRGRLPAVVVGVTGSCGKTTTKGILAQLLERHMPTVASPRSFNNDIGVPLTLFQADEGTRALVCEIGTNHPGEIAALCSIARPTAGVITNVGAAHLAGLGSLEGVANEKADLVRALPADGFCVLNADCRFARAMASETAARALTFSVEGDGDLDARDLWFHRGGTVFRLGGHEVALPLLGTHNVQNCLAALAVCRGLGLALEDVLPHVGALTGGPQRMERIELDGVTVLDDSYNSNPDSARAAVRVLAGLHGFGRRVLVLGDMLELGVAAERMHRDIGMEAARAGIDAVVGIGEHALATAGGARDGGMSADAALHLPDVGAAGAALSELVRDGDVVLVKGSRGMALERLVALLRDERAGVRG